jgi:hypothetical protein
MDSDRRLQSRKATEAFTFIQAEGDDGGRVLNVSEGGLCFETFSPIWQTEPIRLWFSFNLRDRIEALGTIAWMDATKRVVGLRFIGLNQAAREHICKWMNENTAAGARVNDEEGTETVRPSEASEVAANQQNPAAVSSRKTPQVADRSIGLPNASAREQAPAFSFPATELVARERYLSAIRRRFIVGIVLGVLVTSGIALAIFHFRSPGQKRAQATGNAAQKSTQDSGVRAAPPVSSANSDRMSPFSSAPSGQNKSQKMKSSANTPIASLPLSVADRPVQLPRSGPETSRGTLSETSAGGQLPEPISTDNLRRAKKNLATPEQLWALVQAGSATAAVALADLYLRGDGVPPNCDQARVLLLVASAKKNPQAIQKLHDLDKAGCPTPQASR